MCVSPGASVTWRVVPTPNGRGLNHFTAVTSGLHALRDSSLTNDSHTASGGAANRLS